MTQQDLEQLFLDEMGRRGASVERVDDGRFRVALPDGEKLVSLDNLQRDWERDHDPGRVVSFVATVLAPLPDLPAWSEAQAGLRFSAEHSDMDFGDTIRVEVTPIVSRVLVYVDPDESSVTWIGDAQLGDWKVDRAAAEAAAAANMDELLGEMTLTIEDVGGAKLAWLDSPSVFKASIVFAPGLKAFMAPLGWPVLVVAPCRDFFYAFTDQSLLGRLGAVVVREYTTSGYPITPEVLEISDAGLRAIGAFPTE